MGGHRRRRAAAAHDGRSSRPCRPGDPPTCGRGDHLARAVAMTTAATLICAHRGDSAQLPDNSLAAFEAAIALGADMIEADVRLAGNTLVLSHDPAPAGSTPV